MAPSAITAESAISSVGVLITILYLAGAGTVGFFLVNIA